MAKVTLDIAAFDRLADGAAENGLRSALGEYERIMKADVLNRVGTGREYGKHRDSAPGEPPAKDLGNLSANTNTDPNIREEAMTLSGRSSRPPNTPDRCTKAPSASRPARSWTYPPTRINGS